MRCVNTLLVLRILFLALTVRLLMRLCDSVLPKKIVDEKRPLKQGTLWSNISLSSPSAVYSEAAERARLSELLSFPNVQCNVTSQKGAEFKTCAQEEYGTCLLVTLSSEWKNLEAAKKCKKWVLYLPFGSPLIEQITELKETEKEKRAKEGEGGGETPDDSNFEINYLMDERDWLSWFQGDLIGAVKGQSFSHAFVDLSAHAGDSNVPHHLEELFTALNSNNVFLKLTIPKRSVGTTFEIYSMLYYLFFHRNLGTLSAITNGFCAHPQQSCYYSVTLKKFENLEDVRPPVFNLGSPTEERGRLVASLWKPKADCHLEQQKQFQYCDTKIPQSRFVNFNGSMSTDDLMRDLEGNKDTDVVVLINRPGIEWNLLSQIAKEPLKFINVEQFSLSGRLFIEENENYRKFFWDTQHVLRTSYKLMYGVWKKNMDFQLVLRRNSI